MLITKRAGWILSSSAFAAFYQLLVMMIMARQLTQAEVGLYSLVLVFSTLATILQDGGISSFIVHKQIVNRKEYSALFLLSLLFGFITALVLLLISPVLSTMYQQANLPSLMALVAVMLLINSLITPYQASMLLTERQTVLAKTDIISKLLAFIVTFYLLLVSNFGVASALLGNIVASVSRLIMLSLLTGKQHQPCSDIDFSIIKHATKFGSFQTAALIINQLRTRLDQLIIGKLMGMEILAIYSLAKELVSHPNRFIAPLIRNLLFPKLAKHQTQPEQQQSIFNESLIRIAWANTFIFSALAILSGPIVTLMYGKDYSAATSILSILASYGIVRTMGSAYVSFAQAHGRAELEFYWNILAACIMGMVIWLSASNLSIYWTAATLAISQLCLSYLGFYFFRHFILPLKHVDYLRISVLPVSILLVASTLGVLLYH